MSGDPAPESGSVLVSPGRLREFCTRVFTLVDVPEDDAAVIADVLVETDLRGVDTHGVKLLAPYVQALTTPGEITPRPVIRTLRETPSLALLDGDRGMGHVVATQAMERCLAKAKMTGISAVGVRNSCHFGMAAYYAMMALPHDMIGFCTTNVEPIMIAFGGVDPVLGNNPEAYAIPAGDEYPIVIDISHSVVAAGKVGLAAAEGRSIPAGWVTDEHGEPMTNAQQALRDLRLAPAGAAKGYGLAVVMEALAGILTGAKFGHALLSTGLIDQEVGHFFWAFDVAAFIDPDQFKERMDALIREIKTSRPAPGVDRVFLPGERGWLERERRSRSGIPVSRSIWESLRNLAAELGLEAELADTRLNDVMSG